MRFLLPLLAGLLFVAALLQLYTETNTYNYLAQAPTSLTTAGFADTEQTKDLDELLNKYQTFIKAHATEQKTLGNYQTGVNFMVTALAGLVTLLTALKAKDPANPQTVPRSTFVVLAILGFVSGLMNWTDGQLTQRKAAAVDAVVKGRDTWAQLLKDFQAAKPEEKPIILKQYEGRLVALEQ
ncbi:hypothetical protein [Hymenobacter bucti]|uniref:Uncharacterized protein n=1 Tax=Hymenobacter bucti TaxID=1844114 RepID=A0ABW4QY27_9BACT